MGKNVDLYQLVRVCVVSVFKNLVNQFSKNELFNEEIQEPSVDFICPLTVLQSYLSITIVHCWVQSQDCSVVSNMFL